GRVGQELTANGVGLQVNQANQLPGASSGGPVTVRVQVQFANRGAGALRYEPASFSLHDANGDVYAPRGGGVPGGGRPPGGAGAGGRGGRVTGTLEFAVRSGGKGMFLRLDPGLSARGVEPLQVFLGDL